MAQTSSILLKKSISQFVEVLIIVNDAGVK